MAHRNRRALVTGAAGGLAAGIAPALARDGFGSVTITYRSTPPDATLASIEGAGCAAAAQRVDFLEQPQAVESALAEAVRSQGPFDTLVHAVGPLLVRRFEQSTLDEYREILDGNLRSAVLAARAVLPAMREKRFGR
ncbi:MAG TPA: SDR family NAD(P)-dependent oxidoreductase, partial [Candidatus Nitrosotalea sp.]|nr:SDR family NAD(P)-dependent oxidoreductase [Candidatus Nitrosotalea sp.]